MTGRPERSRFAAPSILDRLMDDHPDQPSDRPRRSPEAMADLRRAIHRDVEALLNARRPWRSVWIDRPTLQMSPVAFGLSDFTAGILSDRDAQESLRMEIETVIRRFEPRLAAVQVQLSTPDAPLSATLALRIDAMLLVEPQPEPVSFDTIVEAATADVTVRLRQEA